MKTKKLTAKQKRTVIDVIDGKISKAEAARQNGTSPRSITRWIEKFQGLMTDTKVKTKNNPKKKTKTTVVKTKVVESTVPEYTFFGSEDSVTISDGTESIFVPSDDRRFPDVMDHLLKGKLKDAFELANTKVGISKLTNGAVTVEGGQVKVNGFPVKNNMSQRILDAMLSEESVDDIKTMMSFLQNLVRHPDERVIDELWDFLSHNSIKVNADGSFIAYKYVRDDYKDCYTGTIDNSVGATPEMPRHLVDNNKNQTCSTGLHFAAYRYAASMGGERLMILKVWPEHVISIPTDYNGEKGRCFRYEVIGEVEDRETFDPLTYAS